MKESPRGWEGTADACQKDAEPDPQVIISVIPSAVPVSKDDPSHALH